MNNKDLLGKRIDLLDQGWLELQDIMGDDLAIINAARTSFLGESKGDIKDKKLLFYLMKNNHSTPFENVVFKFRIKCPLFVARQWMRHRTWSYNEVSRRYTSESIEFHIPNEWRYQDKQNRQSSSSILPERIDRELSWECATKGISGNVQGYTHVYSLGELLEKYCMIGEGIYNCLIDNNVTREQARFFLPINLFTEFVATVDAHNLMHFLKLRMDSHAQYEIRVYADAIYEHFFKPALPWTAEAFEKYRLGNK